MRIRRNDGTKLMIDPSLYKNNLQKFSDNAIDVKPKPLDQLTYFYTDYINLSDDEKKTIKMTAEQSNKVRLESIKQRALEKKAEKDKITQVLRKDDGSTKYLNFKLFDSGEEYNNNEKSSLVRLNLQKSDFVSDDENNDTDENNF
ncbi:hypothetical protein C2G38_2054733 [Gigaspora rosea]|uniref:Uncharacterized protein n=1 Tax=Gigaspora rosea TaxID=44941 RepID=A0A397W7T7_9GLOM|nr:hypothetical protein C2G38_2054733 [Gigaspora rosea]